MKRTLMVLIAMVFSVATGLVAVQPAAALDPPPSTIITLDGNTVEVDFNNTTVRFSGAAAGLGLTPGDSLFDAVDNIETDADKTNILNVLFEVDTDEHGWAYAGIALGGFDPDWDKVVFSDVVEGDESFSVTFEDNVINLGFPLDNGNSGASREDVRWAGSTFLEYSWSDPVSEPTENGSFKLEASVPYSDKGANYDGPTSIQFVDNNAMRQRPFAHLKSDLPNGGPYWSGYEIESGGLFVDLRPSEQDLNELEALKTNLITEESSVYEHEQVVSEPGRYRVTVTNNNDPNIVPEAQTFVFFTIGTEAELAAIEKKVATEAAKAAIDSELDKIGVELNTDELGDLSNTEDDAVFAKPEVGSITFGPGLDILGSQEELSQLSTGFNLFFDEELKAIRAIVDTDTLTFLSGQAATIRFFNVSTQLGVTGITADNFRDFLTVMVLEGEVPVTENLTDYFDWDLATYDSEADVLTLPVKHFTEYRLAQLTVEADEDGTVDATAEADDAELAKTGGPVYSLALLASIVGAIATIRRRALN